MEEEARLRSAGALEEVRQGVAMMRAAEIRMAKALVEMAEHYQMDERRVVEHLADKTMPYAPSGCPEVSEFLALEVGAALGMSESAAGNLIASVLRLRYRHPRLWDAFCQGRIRRWEADRLADMCTDLSPMAVDWVDQRICAKVGAVSFTRLRHLVRGLVAQADPELSARQERARRQARYVGFGFHEHGSASVWGQIAGSDAHALECTVEEMSQRMAELGDERSRDERRAAAFGMLADPNRAALWLSGEVLGKPTVKRRAIVYVHLSESALTVPEDGIARIEGIGPLTTESLPEFLRGTHVSVRPVIDVPGITAVDSYEIPEPVREAVALRHQFDTFPFSSLRSRHMDQDHIQPWRHHRGPGQTGLHNLGPLSRRAHRAKTRGTWLVEWHDEFTVRWTSPLGYEYLSGPRGSRLVAQPP